MPDIEIHKAKALKGEIIPPPDKSISHRAVMLASISKGKSVIRNFLRAGDTLSTLSAMRSLGVKIADGQEIVIEGSGLHLVEPIAPIDCGNSGTTMRLLSGILSGNPFFSILVGDESLTKRPMARVIAPLRQMGSHIMSRGSDRYPPLAIRGGRLDPISYTMPLSSAQVKSAILLAGLYADGLTEVSEPVKSRDHTEVMLPAFGADLSVEGLAVRVLGGKELRGTDCMVPADFSSAAFFIVAGLIVPDSEILIKSVGLNPTRTGLLKALEKMGAKVRVENMKEVSGEPIGDIVSSYSPGLKAIEIGGDEIPAMIDEFPILCIAAAFADGVTKITGAGELRVKESDRIKAMTIGLSKMGVEAIEHEDGLSIKRTSSLRGATIDSHADHRIAMAFSVAGLAAHGKTTIAGAEAVDISFPGFYKILGRLRG